MFSRPTSPCVIRCFCVLSQFLLAIPIKFNNVSNYYMYTIGTNCQYGQLFSVGAPVDLFSLDIKEFYFLKKKRKKKLFSKSHVWPLFRIRALALIHTIHHMIWIANILETISVRASVSAPSWQWCKIFFYNLNVKL